MKLELRRSDQCDVRKIGAVTGRVAGDESVAFGFGLCSDVEIRQRRGFRSAAAPVFQKGLRCEPPGGVRQYQSLKNRRIKPLVKISSGGEGGREFRIDDWVDENRTLAGGGAELLLRPRQPDWISRGDVQQDVRIKRFIPRRE